MPGWLAKSTCRELEVLDLLGAEERDADAAGANGTGDWVQDPSDSTGEWLDA
jgi:hypothetical protein